jgi:hypothetical protein
MQSQGRGAARANQHEHSPQPRDRLQAPPQQRDPLVAAARRLARAARHDSVRQPAEAARQDGGADVEEAYALKAERCGADKGGGG